MCSRAVGDPRARIAAARRRTCVVRELDAAAALGGRRARFEAALDEIAAAIGAGEAPARDGALRELMDLAPPGIDELFGILSVVDARADYDVIVVDTAPTGHALRLLEMPEAAREWVQVLLRVLLKYRRSSAPASWRRSSWRSRSRFASCRRCCAIGATTRFIVVTRAAEVPRRETERLLRAASAPEAVDAGHRRQRDDAGAGALRAVPRDRRGRAARARRAAALRAGCAIIRTPLSAPPPRGVRALDGGRRPGSRKLMQQCRMHCGHEGHLRLLRRSAAAPAARG